MKKILATSILFTLFVTAQGCGHMYGSHKHDHKAAACECDKPGATCKCSGEDTAQKEQKKVTGCAVCSKGA